MTTGKAVNVRIEAIVVLINSTFNLIDFCIFNFSWTFFQVRTCLRRTGGYASGLEKQPTVSFPNLNCHALHSFGLFVVADMISIC